MPGAVDREDFRTAGVGGRVDAPARALHRRRVTMDCLSATTTGLVVLLSTACAGCASDHVTEAQPEEARSDAPSTDAGPDGGSARPPGSEPSDDAATVGVASDSSDAGAPAPPPDGSAVSDCPIVQTPWVPARAARSAGYAGSDTAYYALYGPACASASDCVPACVAAGGTTTSCTSGSQCLAGAGGDGGAGCVPPPVWLTVRGALSESGMTTNAAQVALVSVAYEDSLWISDFEPSIPDDAVVTGIEFRVRRATLSGNAVDDAVQVLRDGEPAGSNLARSDAWPTALDVATYGGAYETWGLTWTAADVRALRFGVSIAPKYTGPVDGNERAYIDSVRLAVFYAEPCSDR